MPKARKKLLLITPAPPDLFGNGTSIRAALLLESALLHFDAYVLIAVLEKPHSPALLKPLPEFITKRATKVIVVPLLAHNDPRIDEIVDLRDPTKSPDEVVAFFQDRMRHARTAPSANSDSSEPFMCTLVNRWLERQQPPFDDITFDVVLTISLGLIPFALRQIDMRNRPRCVVDLNDVESTKHQRLSQLHSLNGSRSLAMLTADEAQKLDAFEQKYLPLFDLILTCSAVDRDEVMLRLRVHNVEVAPNAIPHSQMENDKPAVPQTDFLFVGTLGYFPNADAVAYFCRDILPKIAQRMGYQPTFQVIGRGLPHALKRFEQIEGVTISSDVADLTPFYASARICVVPLRAGGGTRLKILEAFAYRRAVVSTTLGCEGIEAIDGQHLLLADDPHAFAAACCRLLNDQALNSRLAAEGFSLVQSKYGFEDVSRMIGKTIASLDAAADAVNA
jgi:glycosyltransferase involved in cell wall biosynthesis